MTLCEPLECAGPSPLLEPLASDEFEDLFFALFARWPASSLALLEPLLGEEIERLFSAFFI